MSIVSDIDDAPIVTADDIKERDITNEEKKAKLKEAKMRLNEMHDNIRTLSPLVQEDYDKTKATVDKSAALAQKIIDTRLKLTRLRQTHPQPRLTIAAAEQKAGDQITEMQELSDQVDTIRKQVQKSKEEVKVGNIELEKARVNRAEAEKLVKSKAADVREDDPRIEPLYEWCVRY
jgi:chromosome segregation ATPase